MRIGIASLDYPPASTEGVARQRQVLARSLARLGHDVHVITLGAGGHTVEGGVHVHRYDAANRTNTWLDTLPVLDRPLTQAQLLCEGVLDVARHVRLDVVDVPLWLAQPLALVRHAPCPVVVWLQTTLRHLVELQQRPLRAHEQVLAGIDRYVLESAAACIADSAAVAHDIERLYGIEHFAARTGVVLPGLDDDDANEELRSARSGCEALVVGRLEQRKGTRELFEILPRLLAAAPDLTIRFVGRDNSGADGFQRETGLTYPEAFARRHPALAERVHFDGYVDDARLAECYRRADLLLHPALYESFGLIFLEAMRAALPVVAFRHGGAVEIFCDGGTRTRRMGASAGAALCEPGDFDGIADAVAALAVDPSRRARLGRRGREQFLRRFTSDRMARDTVAVYERVASTSRPAPAPVRPRVFQIMEALQDRDAVSAIARANADVLAELGGERPILALFAAETVRRETGRLRGMRFGERDAAIVHYWGFSRLERFVTTFPGRLAIHYHNITPPAFFSPRSQHYEMTRRGLAQLRRIVGRFDLLLGDSHYNLAQLAPLVDEPRPSLCVYPVVDAVRLREAPWDRAFAQTLRRESDGPIWFFAGRFAPNKRQDQLVDAFEHFAASGGRGRLVLAGDTTAVPAFTARVLALRERSAYRDRITVLGSIPDERLRACYRAADLFVCASEHEGFCVPLAEAMAFGVPALALDRGAVAETLDEAGVLLSEWDPIAVAGLAHEILASRPERERLRAAQLRRLRAFSPAAVRQRLDAVVRFLRFGESSFLFHTMGGRAAGLLSSERRLRDVDDAAARRDDDLRVLRV